MVTTKSSKASSALILIIIVVAIIISVAVYYLLINKPPDQPSNSHLSTPEPEIISEKGYRSFTPSDIYTIEVAVKNNGGKGFAKVYAKLDAFGESFEKSERIYLENTEIQDIEFVFNLDPYTKTPSPTETFLPYPTIIPGTTPTPLPQPTPTPPPISFQTWVMPD